MEPKCLRKQRLQATLLQQQQQQQQTQQLAVSNNKHVYAAGAQHRLSACNAPVYSNTSSSNSNGGRSW
jgi:transcription initiation factor TFIID subunit TAF12